MRNRVMATVTVVLSVCAMVGVLIAAIPNPAQFELDGNAVVDGGPADDWANTVPPPPSASSGAFASTFIADGSGNATIFTTGGSKDTNDITQWRHKDQLGGLPDKDNITNAYAAAYVDANQDLIIYFGADRFTTEGDAQLGFWFFRNQVQAVGDRFVGADGVTPVSHANGDILVLANLSNGGTVFTAQVFQWNNGGLVLLTNEADAKCGTNTDPRVCFTANAVRETAPWAYQAKGEAPGQGFPELSFFEGGINITQFVGAGAGCFSSFLAETRSSTSQTATLKDFALGAFNTCKLDIAKACPTVTYDQATNLLTYTSEITLTNSGFGTLFDLTMTDTPTPPGQASTQTLASLAAGASHVFTHQFTYTPSLQTPNPPSNTATASAATQPGGQQIVNAGTATATCPQVSFDSALTITKSCTSAIEVQNDRLVVAINVTGTVCNVPPAPVPGGPFPEAINGVVVSDTPAFFGGNINLGNLAINECKDYTAKYYPNLLTVVGGNPSSNPGEQVFTDTAAAQGTGSVTGSARANSASATCPLCPPVH